MSGVVYLNDNYVAENEAKVSVFDRGFLFADGVYEVIPVYNGKILFLKEHLARLQKNLDLINIKYLINFLDWQNICNKLITNNGLDRPLYIQITRGNENRRNHDYSDDIKPTIVAYSLPPITLGNCLTAKSINVMTFPDNRWNHCDVKSIALLGNILLRQIGKKNGCDEVLLTRSNGFIVEGTTSNYFIVKNNKVITPPLSSDLLPGITRQIIIELCKSNNIDFAQENILLEDILNCDEIWLSSSTKELTSVVRVNNTVINNGQPGPFWHRIANLYINNIKQILNG